MRCIFCPNPISSSTAPEHILLAALGGRRTTSRVLCDDCNHAFGDGPDKVLADSVKVIRNLMNYESGRGDEPPEIRGPVIDGHQVILAPGAIPRLGKGKPFEITPLQDGREDVRVTAHSADHLTSILPHLARKMRISEVQLANLLAAGKHRRISQRVGSQPHRLSLGGPEAMRSMIKSSLVVWADRQGNSELDKPQYAKAKQFALHGGDDLAREIAQLDWRGIADDHPFVRRFGMHFNAVWVSSNSAGQVLGYFRLYNICGWRFLLCDSGGVPGRTAGLVCNPAKPEDWDEFAAPEHLTFEWISEAGAYGDPAAPREALKAMLRTYHEAGAETEIDRIFADAIAKLALRHDQPLTADQVEHLAGEVAPRMAAWMLGLPFEDDLSPEEAMRLITGKTAANSA